MTIKGNKKTRKAKKKATRVKVHDLGTIKTGKGRYPEYMEKGFYSKLTNHEEGVLTAKDGEVWSGGGYDLSMILHKVDGTSEEFIKNVGEIYSLRSSPNGIITFKRGGGWPYLVFRGGRKRGFSTFDDISNWVPWGPENGILFSHKVCKQNGAWNWGKSKVTGRVLTLTTILLDGLLNDDVLYTNNSGNFEFDFKTSQGGSAVTRETVGGNNIHKLHKPGEDSREIYEGSSDMWLPCHKGLVVEENKSGDKVLTAHGIWRGKSGVELYRGPMDKWATYGDNSVMVETSKGRETTITLYGKDGSEVPVYRGPIGKGTWQIHPRGLVYRTDEDKVSLYELLGERSTKKPKKITLPSKGPYRKPDHVWPTPEDPRARRVVSQSEYGIITLDHLESQEEWDSRLHQMDNDHERSSDW